MYTAPSLTIAVDPMTRRIARLMAEFGLTERQARLMAPVKACRRVSITYYRSGTRRYGRIAA